MEKDDQVFTASNGCRVFPPAIDGVRRVATGDDYLLNYVSPDAMTALQEFFVAMRDKAHESKQCRVSRTFLGTPVACELTAGHAGAHRVNLDGGAITWGGETK